VESPAFLPTTTGQHNTRGVENSGLLQNSGDIGDESMAVIIFLLPLYSKWIWAYPNLILPANNEQLMKTADGFWGTFPALWACTVYSHPSPASRAFPRNVNVDMSEATPSTNHLKSWRLEPTGTDRRI
jgi:hypothetical protein